MDDVIIHIETLVIDGGTPPDLEAIAAAIGRPTSELLGSHLLPEVAHAVIESAQTWIPGDER